MPVLRRTPDGSPSSPPWMGGRTQACPPADAQDRTFADLSGARTSEPHPAHKRYPYLLRKLVIERPNHVWCADVTYIPMRRGFLYLVAVMDWATRKVLAWRLSNTMEADFCVAALKDAMDVHGRPEIFNTDQGSHVWTAPLGQGLLQERWEGLGCGHVFGLLARDMIAPLALMRKSAWFCRPISSTRSHSAPAALWAFRTCPLLTSPRQSPSMLARPGAKFLLAKPLAAVRPRPAGRRRPRPSGGWRRRCAPACWRAPPPSA